MTDYSLWSANLGAVYKIVADRMNGRMLAPSENFQVMLKKYRPQVRKQVWRITSREKVRRWLRTYDGVDVSDITEIKVFHPTYLHQKTGFVILKCRSSLLVDIAKQNISLQPA